MQNPCRLTQVQYSELSKMHFWLWNVDKPSLPPTKKHKPKQNNPKTSPPKQEYTFTTQLEVIEHRSKSKNCWRSLLPAQLPQQGMNQLINSQEALTGWIRAFRVHTVYKLMSLYIVMKDWSLFAFCWLTVLTAYRSHWEMSTSRFLRTCHRTSWSFRVPARTSK